jgi:hypothetical protein
MKVDFYLRGIMGALVQGGGGEEYLYRLCGQITYMGTGWPWCCVSHEFLLPSSLSSICQERNQECWWPMREEGPQG